MGVMTVIKKDSKTAATLISFSLKSTKSQKIVELYEGKITINYNWNSVKEPYEFKDF